MATLLLTAVGTAIGGPLGGAIGAVIGQQADRAIFGTGTREGPRLKELSVTTSSYGQPMARLFGRMRVPGTVIWSTDLIESSEKSGGGKGRPSTKTYSYSASFAVALSSSPVAALGRIWADGELLRGAAGDLKADGALRFYNGHGHDPVDPLIAAEKGQSAPAFRDCAYVVFENLQLADFGNRIPALTFEIMSENDGSVALADIVPNSSASEDRQPLPQLRGFSDEGGPIVSSLSALDRIFPLTCVTKPDGIKLAQVENSEANLSVLPNELYDPEQDNNSRKRAETIGQEPFAIRYYDEERDYQPGVQRAIGSRPNGREAMIDIPATMQPDGARQIANENAHRARWRHERISRYIGELDPSIEPGTVVLLPDTPGRWLIKSWEWLDRGIELNLERLAPSLNGTLVGDAGSANVPDDQLARPTLLSVFEVPSDGSGAAFEPTMLAATSSTSSAWRGAALYVEQESGLAPIGNAGVPRSIFGELVEALSTSNATHFEPNASVLVSLPDNDLGFSETTLAGLALGENRILIGAEVVQFVCAEPDGAGLWRLSGLLRGRGGTEDFAAIGHSAGTAAILLDNKLTSLDSSKVQSNASTRIAAIGLGDDEPAYAYLSNAGLSRRPLTPVHARLAVASDGSWEICWTRRARGQWLWEDMVETPLVEEQEAYVIGYGSIESPAVTWASTETRFELSSTERDALVASFGPSELWVRQVGTFSSSPAIRLATII